MKIMQYEVIGYELNIYHTSLKFKEIKNSKNLFSEIKKMHLSFSDSRESHPANIQEIMDDKCSNISFEIFDTKKSFLMPEKQTLIFGHYFVYESQSYSLNSDQKLKKPYIETRDLCGENVVDNIYFDKSKKIVLDMEPEDSGESTAEQTFCIWIDSKGKFFSEAFDFSVSGLEEGADYEDDKKEKVEDFSSLICKDLDI
tara:strand:+ start:172 stop:768 length:597 start_codon:yes stop_codon:yes gene_type:complete